jgi:hypothetical protein
MSELEIMRLKLLRAESELRKWQKPFNEENLNDTREQYETSGHSHAAARAYINGLEHALAQFRSKEE